MTYHTIDICELQNRLASDCSKSVRVANLIGSLEQEDNPDQILLNGLARRKTSFIRGTNNWHEVLLPIRPAACTLGIDESQCQESLLLQIGACNLRCWYCFVDTPLITGAQNRTKTLGLDKVINYLKTNNQYKIVHISGGEPLLATPFISRLRDQLDMQFGRNSPYLWMETNLTVSPLDLSLDRFRSMEDVFHGRKSGIVGCFRSIIPDEYRSTIGNLDINWLKQFAVAKTLCDMGADFYSTVVLMVKDVKNINTKIKYFFDMYIQYMGEKSLDRILPIEIRPYTPTKTRLGREQEKLIRSQYEVLPIWEEIHQSYLGSKSIENRLIKIKEIN